MRSRTLPTLAILVSVLIFFGYTNPTYNGSIATAKAAIESNKNALKAAELYQENADKLAAEQAAMDQEALARLMIFLPDSVNNIGVILDVNALAARSGLVLSSANVSGSGKTSSEESSETSSNPVASVDLLLSAKGTYPAFRSFLSGLEASQRLIDVTDILVTGSDTGVYTYQMTLRLYWLR